MDDLASFLGIAVPEAIGVVVSATVLYFVFAAILFRFGQRLLAAPSSLELALVTVLGAVVGRSMLGPRPTLTGGLLALATLFALERASGRVGRMRRVQDGGHRAVALVVAGRPDRAALRRHGMDDVALWGVLRNSGVRTMSEVALVVVERGGQFSVMRVGEPIHPAALTGVRHANQVMAELAAEQQRPAD